MKELEEGNKRRKWVNREPHAYWKGNPYVRWIMTHIDAVSPNEFPNKKISDAPNRVTRFAKSATKPTVVGNESSDLDGYGEGDKALLVVLLFSAESIGFLPRV